MIATILMFQLFPSLASTRRTLYLTINIATNCNHSPENERDSSGQQRRRVFTHLYDVSFEGHKSELGRNCSENDCRGGIAGKTNKYPRMGKLVC